MALEVQREANQLRYNLAYYAEFFLEIEFFYLTWPFKLCNNGSVLMKKAIAILPSTHMIARFCVRAQLKGQTSET